MEPSSRDCKKFSIGKKVAGSRILTSDGHHWFSIGPALKRFVPRPTAWRSEVEKVVPLEVEDFESLMTQVSFVNYDGVLMDVP